MVAYNAWNGVPMAINSILKSIVQKQWGVDVLSSDGGAVKLLVTSHKRFANQQEAVVACLKSGINQFLDTYKDETKAAVKEGLVTEAEIDDLLRPKFRVTIRLGLRPIGSRLAMNPFEARVLNTGKIRPCREDGAGVSGAGRMRIGFCR
jgi:beta-glucosidase